MIRQVGCPLICAALLFGACGGKSSEKGNGPAPTSGTGATGGTLTGTGGTLTAAGGTAPMSEGGAPAGNDGGSADVGTSSGGSGNAGAGGSLPAVDCAKVSCPSIPATCKKIVQDPNECCPTCPDTGCGACPEIGCGAGTHSETAAGDCCPSCVDDPPDQCARGQETYVSLRAQLLEKYGSSGCKNSSECALLLEDNACAYACNIALPSQSSSNFTANLLSTAMGCATCEAPARAACEARTPACVNGKCIAADAPAE